MKKPKEQRKPYEHLFVKGVCKKCGVKIDKAIMRLCPVIGSEELANLRMEEIE